MHVPSEEQATSRGAAILALNALGVWDGLDDVMPEIAAVYEPRGEYGSVYEEAVQRQAELYGRVV